MKRFIVLLCLWLPALANAQSPPSLAISTRVIPETVAPGAPFQIEVTVEVPKPWHLNANPAGDRSLIPTTLRWEPPTGITVGTVQYPEGKQTPVSWTEKPIGLYDGRVTILTEARAAADLADGLVTLAGQLRYQACDDHTCFAPTTVPITVELRVGGPPASGSGGSTPTNLTASAPNAPPQSAATAVPPESATAENSIEALIRQRGWLLALVFLFLGGLALNLTPCVYPMIAITVSYFGGQGERRLGQAFASAATYFVGIVLTYSALGLAAALTGGLFGALLQSPWVLAGIAVLLVALALSMFGLYEIQPPQFLLQKATGLSGRAGLLGVFFLGAMVGIIAAPCVAPILVALLVYVGQRGDPWLGWWLFFTLAAGLGLPYVVLGTFSGLLHRLPKSGTWMVWVKRVFGVGLVLVAFWITKPLWGATAKGGVEWEPYSAERLAAAQAAGQPVMIDFYADWCLPCREMEKITFSDPAVIAKSRELVRLKADLTHSGEPAVEALVKQYNIAGVPTIVFIDPNGQERQDLRLLGFEGPKPFLERLRQLRPEPAN